MKKIFSRMTLVLMIVLVIFCTYAFAADFGKMEPTDGAVSLDGTNPGSVTVYWTGTGDQNIYGIEGRWSTKETNGTNYLTLTSISSDVLSFTGMNYADAESGKLMWTDDTFSNPGVVSSGKHLLAATYKVAADTPAGTYMVTYSSENLAGDDFENDASKVVVTAKITVSRPFTPVHEHSYPDTPNGHSDTTHWFECTDVGCPDADKGKKDEVVHSGGNATCTEKATCTACNQKYGALNINNHIHKNEVAAVPSTCKTAGHAAYTKCADCNVIVTGSDVALPLNPNNHESQKGVEWEKDNTGHWHVYPCCNAKADEAAHTPGAAATETTPQICTTCGYVITPALGHVHTSHLNSVAAQAPTCTAPGNDAYWKCDCGKLFSDAAATTETTLAAVTKAALGHTPDDWQFDNDNHWKVCATCHTELDKAAHVNFDKWQPGVDGHYHECSVCHKRSEVTPHTDYEWAYDNTQHWLICKECGYEQAGSRENHTFEGDSKNCSQQCGYTKSSNITIITPTQPGDSKPAEGNPSTGAVSGPVGYVFVGLAAVGALCLGAKKLTKKHED